MDAQWQSIETAPKDKPIVGWCVHEADLYFYADVYNVINGSVKLTTYGAHCEGLNHVQDGPHVLEWGGAWDDRSYDNPDGGYVPNWWFQTGTEFETVANPTHWMDIPESPLNIVKKPVCIHDLSIDGHTILMTHDTRTDHEYESVATCTVCKQSWRHPLYKGEV